MSEHAEQLFGNPRRLLQDGPTAKQAHREHLAAILTGRATETRADKLAERIAAKIAPAISALIDLAVGEVAADTAATVERPTVSFDGGVRSSPPLTAPTHDEFIVALVRSRLADVGSRL